MYYTLKILENFAEEYKILIILYIVASLILQPFYSVILPRIYSTFFETLASHKNSPSHTIQQILTKYMAYIIFSLCFISFLTYLIGYLQDKIVPKLIEYMTTFMFTNILYQHENNYSEIDISKVYRYITDVPHDLLLLSNEFIKIFPYTLSFISVIVYLFYVNMSIGIVATILYTTSGIITNNNFPKCTPLIKEKVEEVQKIMSEINNKLSNLSNIYNSGYLEEEISEFENISKTVTEKKIIFLFFCPMIFS